MLLPVEESTPRRSMNERAVQAEIYILPKVPKLMVATKKAKTLTCTILL